MVVIVVAKARVNWIKLSICQVCGDVVASERGNHEGVDEILIEEIWHVHRTIVSVDCYLLVLKFFFDRWHVVLYFDHQVTVAVV